MVVDVEVREAELLLAELVPDCERWGAVCDWEQAAPFPASAGTLTFPVEGSEMDENPRLEISRGSVAEGVLWRGVPVRCLLFCRERSQAL